MKISLSDLHSMNQAFSALGGRQIEASDGDKKVVILKPYDIDGDARYAIGKMRRAAQIHLKKIEEERADLVEASGMPAAELDKDPVKLAKFKADMVEFLNTEVEFNEHRIKTSALKIGTNQLDTGIIEALLPVLDGDV